MIPRQLTIMIYMCGSNLESEYGAATVDLNEMSAAGAGNDQVSVLVMVGGAKSWMAGYEPEETTILEIRRGRRRVVHTEEKRDMGAETTLTDFLRFGRENYPAQDYALILWDHGGGVLEGVCWDEQFSSSRLSFQEVRNGIEKANLGQRLSWIGFDACLMSSLEIATGLSSVADYMIASQETEPSFGWNYSFLKGIEEDGSPLETGRRIVDSYFEGHEDRREVMTLACIDLSRASDAAEALGDYFSEIEKGINADNYPELANLRETTRGFGTGLRGIEFDGGYDLVDAESLIEQSGGNEEKRTAAISALREAVAYHRANVDDACGLTLYHPWANKTKYLSEWSTSYKNLNLISGYTNYVQSFGTLLTEKELIRWKNLITRAMGRNEKGEHGFQLKLTEEEASHVASAQLLIVQQSGYTSRLDDGVAIVGVSRAELTEEHILQAAYDERAIYVEKENGELMGPMSYLQTADGNYNVIRAIYVHKGRHDFEQGKNMLFYLDARDASGTPEIIQTRIWDDETQSYSPRIPFDRDQYRMVRFWDQNRVYPEADEGVLADFYSWEPSSLVTEYVLPLPEEWRFVTRDEQLTGRQLYAMFRITDVQQNIYCSLPVPIENQNRDELQMTQEQGSIPGCEIGLTGYMDVSDAQAMGLEFMIRNTGSEACKVSLSRVLINDDRELDMKIYQQEIPAGEEYIREWQIPVSQLALLEEVREISFLFERETENHTEREKMVFRLEGCDLKRMNMPVSMGHAETEGVMMDLLDIQPDNSGWKLTFLIRNQGEALLMDKLTLNGLGLRFNTYEAVEQGTSRVITQTWNNGIKVDNSELDVPDTEGPLYETFILNRWMELYGQTEVSDFGAILCPEKDFGKKNSVYIEGSLKEPWSMEEMLNPGSNLFTWRIYYPPEAMENTEPLTLTENDRLNLKLRRAVLGESRLILVMELTNETDETVRVRLDDVFVNDQKNYYTSLDISSLESNAMPPRSTTAFYISLKLEDLIQAEEPIHTISLLFNEQGEKVGEPALMNFREPIQAGAKEGLVWFSPEDFEIRTAQLNHFNPSEDAEKTRVFEEQIQLPLYARQYARWLTAPLSMEEMEAAAEGVLLLVIPEEQENNYAILEYEKLTKNEEGELGVLFPDLVLCIAENEADLIPVRFGEVGEQGFAMESLYMGMFVSNMDFEEYQSMGLKYLSMEMNYDENRAIITDIQPNEEGDMIERQDQMQLLEWFVFHGLFAKKGTGDYVSLQDLEYNRSDFVGWNFQMNGKPVPLAMRPIRETDNLSLLFSITNQDGTSYSRIQPWKEK